MAFGNPISLTPNVASKIVGVAATDGQKTFTVTGGYRINELGVFRNGVRLVQDKDYVASNGTTVVLTNGCTSGDTVEFDVFDNFHISGAINSVGNQTLNGDLYINGTLTGVSTVSYATTCFDLFGTPNITVGNLIGAATTLSGAVKATDTTASSSTSTGALVVSGGVGIAKSAYIGGNLDVTGAVSVGGTLTYEDVTNVDAIGVVTARLGVIATAGRGVQITAGGLNVTAGVSTFTPGISASDINASGIVTATEFSGYNQLVAGVGATTTTIVKVITKTANHRYYGQGSSSGYTFDGVESPYVTLTPGRSYTFNQADSSNNGHPLQFYYDRDKTTGYTANVVREGTPGSTGAATTITVTATTPQVLYYQCTAHSLMGNAVNTNTGVVDVTGISTFGGLLDANAEVTAAGGVDIAGGLKVGAASTLAAVTATTGTFSGNVDIADTIYHTGDSNTKIRFPSNDTITAATSGSERVRVDSSGDVGINTDSPRGKLDVRGSVTFGGGQLAEKFATSGTALNSATSIDLDEGMVHYRSANLGAASVKPDIISSVGINTALKIGEAIAVTIITAVNSTSNFVSSVAIDGRTTGITTHWVGGDTPSEGGSSGVDIYSFNVLKTASNTFTVVANHSKTS